MNLGQAAHYFVNNFNESVLREDRRYRDALQKFFIDQLSKEADPHRSLTGHEALGIAD